MLLVYPLVKVVQEVHQAKTELSWARPKVAPQSPKVHRQSLKAPMLVPAAVVQVVGEVQVLGLVLLVVQPELVEQEVLLLLQAALALEVLREQEVKPVEGHDCQRASWPGLPQLI